MKIELKAYCTQDKIVCADIRTMQIVIGTTSVVGNYALYGVTKVKNGFEISKKDLDQRRTLIRKRRDGLNETISIMDELLK